MIFAFDRVSRASPSSRQIFAAFFVFVSFLFTRYSAAEVATSEALAQSVRLTVSVDWEGQNLEKENLQAMIKFRDQYPEIHLVHFLNAAYFTKSDVSSESAARKVAEKIRSVLRPGDELGLHIHGLKKFVEASGVRYRSGPTYWGEDSSWEGRFGLTEPGHDVPISLYTRDEIRRMLSFSKQKLQQYGFSGFKSFRAGGWVAAPHVREALMLEGLEAESSEVPVQLLRGTAERTEFLVDRLYDIWGEVPLERQPHWVYTSAGRIEEYPDNGGMSDYVTSEKMLEVFEANLAKTQSGSETYVHFGFHQESAGRYLERLKTALMGMRDIAAKRNIRLQFVTLTGTNALRPSVFSVPPLCAHVL